MDRAWSPTSLNQSIAVLASALETMDRAFEDEPRREEKNRRRLGGGSDAEADDEADDEDEGEAEEEEEREDEDEFEDSLKRELHGRAGRAAGSKGWGGSSGKIN